MLLLKWRIVRDARRVNEKKTEEHKKKLRNSRRCLGRFSRFSFPSTPSSFFNYRGISASLTSFTTLSFSFHVRITIRTRTEDRKRKKPKEQQEKRGRTKKNLFLWFFFRPTLLTRKKIFISISRKVNNDIYSSNSIQRIVFIWSETLIISSFQSNTQQGREDLKVLCLLTLLNGTFLWFFSFHVTLTEQPAGRQSHYFVSRLDVNFLGTKLK